MSTYDIFIKGINPKRLDETEEIKALACEYLKLNTDALDSLLNSGSNCFKKGSTEEQAKAYQLDLAKIGIICVYKPGVVSSGLSLVSIESEAQASNTIACPNCQHVHTLKEGQDKPKECEKCGVLIEKALDMHKKQLELEEIKANILRAQQTKEFFENKQRQEDAEERRKKELEMRALSELQRNKKGSKKNNRMVSIAAGVVGVVLVGGIAFLMGGVSNKALNNADASSSQGAAGNSSGEETLAAESSASANESATSATPPAAEVEADAAQTTEGISMADAHDKANTVLNSVGLDAGAIAKGGKSTGAPDPEIDAALAASLDDSPTGNTDVLLADASASAMGGNATITDSSSAKITAKNATPSPPPAVAMMASSATNRIESKNASSNLPTASIPTQTENILLESQPGQATATASTAAVSVGDNEMEWDLFIRRGISTLVANNALKEALSTAAHIADDDIYIQAMGDILGAAKKTDQAPLVNQILTALESKVIGLPADQQAQFLAQAGATQVKMTGSKSLLNQAETTYTTIADPESQLKSSLRIAVNYAKAGDTEGANRFFKQTSGLLSKISDKDHQIIARAAIARAYEDVGSQTSAIKWLASTEPLANTVNGSTQQELIDSYAYTNRLQNVLELIKKVHPIEKQNELLLSAIRVSLKANLTDNARTLSKELKEPVAKAIALEQLSSYDFPTSDTLSLAEKNIPTIANPADQAIFASLLARHYARLPNPTKAKELSELAAQQAAKVSESGKDTVTALMVTNLARSLQIAPAKTLLTSIQSPAVKNQSMAEITKVETVGSLLKML